MNELEKCLFWCDMINAKAAQITEQLKEQRDCLQEILKKEGKGETSREEA